MGLDYLVGRHWPERDPRFVRVPAHHVAGGRSIFLRRETMDAFVAMAAAARADGVRLRIVSGTRTFEQQAAIWSAAWRGERAVDGKWITQDWPSHEKARWILQWIAKPATSRHHWGTEVDINSTTPGYFEQSPGREEYAWLSRNAARFGFCQTYGPRDEDAGPGYREEKWHWSHLPLSRPLLSEYLSHVGHGEIRGFPGDDATHILDVRKNYVLGIDPACR